jgi:hypothetical protein
LDTTELSSQSNSESEDSATIINNNNNNNTNSTGKGISSSRLDSADERAEKFLQCIRQRQHYRGKPRRSQAEKEEKTVAEEDQYDLLDVHLLYKCMLYMLLIRSL